MGLNTDSSPFQSSPLDGTTSPRLFWMNRHAKSNSNTENDLYGSHGTSPSPTRRTSIERLQKASRVKNSTMFAREQKLEYDPTRLPTIERPLAKVQGNAFGGSGIAGFRPGHGRSQSQQNISFSSPNNSPTKSPQSPNAAGSPTRSPTKDQGSPIKSSLSSHRFKNSCDSQPSDFSIESSSFDEKHDLPHGRSLHRHAKSVTFDAAPPQINEYEMATPDLSSVGTNSREGSFESEEDDYDDYGPYPGMDGDLPDDSFDASLEDTAKTPVVGPDDWRQDREHRFSNSPLPETTPAHPAGARPQHHRSDSSTSSGDHRPLPPLPGTPNNRSHSFSSTGTSATADRMLGSPRGLPSPPAALVSKSELQNIGNGKMSLEERLKLMMLSDEVSPKTDHATKTYAEQQRERRMRRAGPRDKVGSPGSEHEDSIVESVIETTELVVEINTETHDEVHGETHETDKEAHDDVHEEENSEADDTIGDISGLDIDYQLPSISRQSILNRVNGNKGLERDSEYNFNSPGPDSSPALGATPYDPDVPIDSIEDSIMEEDLTEPMEDSVIITRSENADIFDILQRPVDEETESQRDEAEDDDESHYSDEDEEDEDDEDDEDDEEELPTPTQGGEGATSTPQASTPTCQDAITNFSATLPRVNENSAKDSEFTRSFQSYMLPRPKEADAVTHTEGHRMSDAQVRSERTYTPEISLPKPDYDGSGWGDPEEEEEEDPGTPESVIHHPVSDSEEDMSEDEPLESPGVPEQVATIKASGSKLKTRQSATPSDLAAMREARRQVSREIVPNIPPIPEKHRNRLSRDLQTENTNNPASDDFLERHPSFKKRSLTLDLDLGLSLDQDFERVIEAQKVAFQQLMFTNEFLAASDSPTRQVSDSKPMIATSDASTGNDTKKPVLNANITARKQRGYLMRQNTKVVAASDRPASGDRPSEDIYNNTRSAGNSPVKQHRPQSWTVEPWNGKARRSIRKRHAPGMSGPVPPLPGQESNATTTRTSLPEEEGSELATDECGERGRLFVKVMGVKDLDLPLPKSMSAHKLL